MKRMTTPEIEVVSFNEKDILTASLLAKVVFTNKDTVVAATADMPAMSMDYGDLEWNDTLQ